MGRYFSVEGYPGEKSALDFSTGLNSLGDALTDVLSRRQKAKQFQDQLQFDREDAQRKFAQNQGNLDYQNRIIDQREKRDQLKFNQDQGEMQRRATADAAKAMAEGNPEMAKAILHGAVSYDPATGAETGRGELVPGPVRDVGPAPQEPQAPAPSQPVPPEVAARRRGRTSTSEDEAQSFYRSQGRPMPSAVGVDPTEPPIFTDDGKPPSVTAFREFAPSVQASREQATQDMMAEEQARMDAAEHDKAQTAFEAASQAYPHLRAEYEAKQAAARGEQPFTIRFGANDPGVEVNPAALRYGRRQAAAEDFVASLHGVNLDERGQRAAQAAHAALLAGEDPQTVYKAFDAARATGQKFEDTKAVQAQKDAEALKRANVMAHGQNAKDDYYRAAADERRAAGNRQDRGETRMEVADWESKTADTRRDAQSWKRLRNALSNIRSGNPVAQQDGLLALGSYFRGGNAVTKDVTDNLRSHLSGLGGRAEGFLERMQTGGLGDEQVQNAVRAAQIAVNENEAIVRGHEQSFRDSFGPGSGLDSQADMLNHKLRGFLSEFGLAGAPLYGQEGASVPLGFTARPYKPAKTPNRRGPPEVNAHGRGKSASELDDAMGP